MKATAASVAVVPIFLAMALPPWPMINRRWPNRKKAFGETMNILDVESRRSVDAQLRTPKAASRPLRRAIERILAPLSRVIIERTCYIAQSGVTLLFVPRLSTEKSVDVALTEEQALVSMLVVKQFLAGWIG